MAQWFAQVGGQRYGPVGEEEMKSWIAQGRVKPTDYVWCEGMPAWVPAGSALGQTASVASAGPANPLAQQSPADPAAQQQAYVVLAPTSNVPGAVPSMVCGIIGCVIWVPCCHVFSIVFELGGLTLGIVALVLARKAKALLASHPDTYGGKGMATAGYAMGIIAIILNSLCLIGLLIVAIFVGTAFTTLFHNGRF